MSPQPAPSATLAAHARRALWLVALLLGGCQLPTAPSADIGTALLASPPAPASPDGCASQDANARLQLPKTDVPAAHGAQQALEIAQVHTVNRPLQDIGVWSEPQPGWSRLSLEIGSENARSIAVRLRDARWPGSTQAWLCSADGRSRLGPLQSDASGELWTPAVAGGRARLEIWVPSTQRAEFAATLADVYGGYR